MDKTAEVSLEEILPLLGRLNLTYTNTESLLIHLIAGLSGTSKDVALIIYLTLNTTRARTDLVERLAKMDNRAPRERDSVLKVTRQLIKLSGLRNRYNHCIFAVDADGRNPRTIMMRIADRRDSTKMGKTDQLDSVALDELQQTVEGLTRLNRDVWGVIQAWNYPV
ncbi:hypothetical protein [Pseudoruegeria sp. SK021]|uniref:hypothetical protein n=1 Tax=Pseudoruegeria sp. SK021 TaxID=1933035 RepID=UPI000A23E32A|nr:hypothetical protein [Pseudoruegeria sp. SK021]OSP54793.1 hypothetical protein BV911_10755 [Pseudoruegeria sp. SK021]